MSPDPCSHQPGVACGLVLAFGPEARVLRARLPGSTTLRALDTVDEVREAMGGVPDQVVSAATARDLAMAAYQQRDRTDSGLTTFGLGLTADAAQAFAALQTREATITLRGTPGSTPMGLGLVDSLLRAVTGSGEQNPREAGHALATERSEVRGAPDLVELVHGELATVVRLGDWDRSGGPRVVFPGSFHPFHNGHALLARLAHERTGLPVDFELAVVNVDKPTLNYHAIEERTAGLLAGREPHHGRLWLTRAATFREKAESIPGPITFVVGFDTLARIGHARYYADEIARDLELSRLRDEHRARFLVFHRNRDDGQPSGEADFDALPASLRQLCDVVPRDEVRSILAVSSRALRARALREGP